jgi:murein DD-endopeptidase MepM/ murein hydrolase activator NlpD
MKAVVGAFILMMFCSACVTRPMLASRKGLLDREGRSVSGVSDSEIENGTIEDADLEYAPKDGGKIDLYGEWRWPLKQVQISSSYGDRGRKFHQGVDLRAATGTPVLAASDGEVVYVGSKIRGYGRMVVLKHRGNFYSVYAHHSKNLVKHGQRIPMGKTIAYAGKSGHASGPHLHFEIRKGTQSFDPEYALNHNIREFASNRKGASSNRKN